MTRTALTGIQASGTPHIGNYLGMIRPALELAREYRALYFIADYHALTTVREGEALRRNTYEVAATWLALGLDPEQAILYRQSDIPEVFELAWVLACVTPKGLLNRAHAYKAIVDENTKAGRTPDDGVSMGLFNYPILMAADILLFGADLVPVGQDQRQHLEMARDMALWVNQAYGDVLTVPEAVIHEDVSTIPGLDGRKMSKSYDNVIPLLAPADAVRKQVLRIVTDSRRPEEPKDPESDNVFLIYRHFAPPEEAEGTRLRYLKGGIGYAEVKQALAAHLEETFGAPRARYEAIMADVEGLERVLRRGAERAREIGVPIMERVRKAVGTR